MMEAVIVRRHVLDILVPFVLLVLCDCTDVSLAPEGYATVTVSGSLSLTCTYNGSGIPLAAVWTLNDTAVPLTVFFSSCQRVGGNPGLPYDISRYNYTCTNMSNTLNIYSITANDILCWNCTFALSVGQADHKSRTCITLATTTTSTTTTSTTTSITTTVTSSSTSMSSATSSVTIDTRSTNATVSPASNTNNTSTTSGSTTTNNTTSNKSISSDTDIKVIVPAVVVPCGLLIIGGIILVVCFVRRRTGKNVRERPDGMTVQDKGNNIEEWKQSQGHGNATDNLNAVYTTPDGFVLYPGPAAMSTARSYKEKKYLDVTDQYSRPLPGTYHHQAAYVPSTYTSARAYTHKDKKHHGVTNQYSRPYTGNYGYLAGYVPNTDMFARIYAPKGKKYDYEGPIHQQASHLMATGRPDYDQTAYYPQTGYYGQSSQDVYYGGGGQYSYGQKSRSHYDNSGSKQQYEMADYGGNRAGYRHTKQDTAFCY